MSDERCVVWRGTASVCVCMGVSGRVSLSVFATSVLPSILSFVSLLPVSLCSMSLHHHHAARVVPSLTITSLTPHHVPHLASSRCRSSCRCRRRRLCAASSTTPRATSGGPRWSHGRTTTATTTAHTSATRANHDAAASRHGVVVLTLCWFVLCWWSLVVVLSQSEQDGEGGGGGGHGRW